MPLPRGTASPPEPRHPISPLPALLSVINRPATPDSRAFLPDFSPPEPRDPTARPYAPFPAPPSAALQTAPALSGRRDARAPAIRGLSRVPERRPSSARGPSGHPEAVPPVVRDLSGHPDSPSTAITAPFRAVLPAGSGHHPGSPASRDRRLRTADRASRRPTTRLPSHPAPPGTPTGRCSSHPVPRGSRKARLRSRMHLSRLAGPRNAPGPGPGRRSARTGCR